jgi:hypothetical protein
MSTYLVIAYRWGWTNADWYIVYGGPDEPTARALATEERDGRGDKYGCAVYEFHPEGTGYRRIAYECSACGESAPRHNPRFEYLKSLGRFAERLAGGKAYRPDPRRRGRLECVAVEAPEIVAAEVARQRGWLEAAERELAADRNAADGPPED